MISDNRRLEDDIYGLSIESESIIKKKVSLLPIQTPTVYVR